MTEKAIVKIYRFDPAVDKEPRFDTYEVPEEGWRDLRVIETLRYIYENFDSTLSFRDHCRQRLCGACTVLVNKKPVLACDAPSDKKMLIEPISKRPLIKDLVVSLSLEMG